MASHVKKETILKKEAHHRRDRQSIGKALWFHGGGFGFHHQL